jgi:hypothetical protein
MPLSDGGHIMVDRCVSARIPLPGVKKAPQKPFAHVPTDLFREVYERRASLADLRTVSSASES